MKIEQGHVVERAGPGVDVSSLVIDAVNTKKVYAGTFGGGLFAITFYQ